MGKQQETVEQMTMRMLKDYEEFSEEQMHRRLNNDDPMPDDEYVPEVYRLLNRGISEVLADSSVEQVADWAALTEPGSDHHARAVNALQALSVRDQARSARRSFRLAAAALAVSLLAAIPGIAALVRTF